MSRALDRVVDDTPAVDEERYERCLRALSLRNGGATFRQIAELTGVSSSQARKDVAAAKQAIMSDAREDIIAELRSVLLDVRRSNYKAMASGDVDAGRLVLASVAQEREMLGADAPKRSFIGVGSDVQFAADLASLISSVGEDTLAQLARTANSEIIDADIVAVPTVPSSDDPALHAPEALSTESTSVAERVNRESSADAAAVASEPPAPQPWSNI